MKDNFNMQSWVKNNSMKETSLSADSGAYNSKKVFDEENLYEASNPELDKLVKNFIKKLSVMYGYPESEAVMAIQESLKRQKYI